MSEQERKDAEQMGRCVKAIDRVSDVERFKIATMSFMRGFATALASTRRQQTA